MVTERLTLQRRMHLSFFALLRYLVEVDNKFEVEESNTALHGSIQSCLPWSDLPAKLLYELYPHNYQLMHFVCIIIFESLKQFKTN
jgi:hypothetical protein